MRHYLLFFFCLPGLLSYAQSTWKPLFGTNYSEAIYDPHAWTINDGVIMAEEDDCFWSKEAYENFELDLEFKNDNGTNSGVVIYCTDMENWIPNSLEVQIADDYYEKWAEAKSYERCGAVYGHLGPRMEQVVKKPGEWNHLRIRANGQKISVVLNGRKVTEMDMSQWTSGTHNPDGSEIPSWLPTPFAELPTNGMIGLQGKHGDATVWFRNVKIRELNGRTTGATSRTERENIDMPAYQY